jgi:hypothetical protein
MTTYYSGVPVGSTIPWIGDLAGLSIPENFVVNRGFSGTSNPRKPLGFANSLPYSDGLLKGGTINTKGSVTNNQSKTISNVKLDTKTVKHTANAYKYDFTNLKQEVSVNYKSDSGSVYNSGANSTYVIVGTGAINNDWVESGGNGSYYMTGTYSGTTAVNAPLSHAHNVNNTNYPTNHSHELKTTATFSYNNNTNTVSTSTNATAVSYALVPPSITVIWITRVY